MVGEKTQATGILKVRNCCLFTWRTRTQAGVRTFIIRTDHCDTCIAELRRLAKSDEFIVDSAPGEP